MTTILAIIIGFVLLVILLDFFTGFRIFKSLFNRVRKRTDEAAESLRDPVADAHAALADIKSKRVEMVELRKSLLIEVKRASARTLKAVADVTKWENLAKMAGQAGNVADVKAALEKKAVAQKDHDLAELDVKRISAQEDALEDKIKEFDNLIDKAENDKNFLESSLKINKFNTAVNTVLKDNNGTALSALDRLREDVQISAFEAELSGEMAEEVKGLEGKYAVASGISDDEVAQYLKK